MKRIIITLVVLGFACSVNAQQLPLLPKAQPLEKFKVVPDSLARNNFLFKQPNGLQRVEARPMANAAAKTNIDNMPVVRMQGNSNMPVAQTDVTGYNMPVVGMANKQVVQSNATPNMPFLGGKPPIYYEFKKYPDNTPPADSTRK